MYYRSFEIVECRRSTSERNSAFSWLIGSKISIRTRMNMRVAVNPTYLADLRIAAWSAAAPAKIHLRDE